MICLVLKILIISIITTSKGVVSNKKAKKLSVGGNNTDQKYDIMSQIGRKIINIPDDVNVTNEKNNNIIVKKN